MTQQFLLPATVVVFFDVVRVDHEGFDRIAAFEFFAIEPLVVQFSDGLTDGHRGLGAGTGNFTFGDQGFDVRGTVDTVDQGLGAGSFSSSESTQGGRVVTTEDGNSIRILGQRIGTVQVTLFLVAHAVDLGNNFETVIFDRFKETVGAVNNGLHGRGIQDDDLTAFRALFDEVDTGISGSAAEKVGLKLKQVSRESQVLCVTHQAQIAALADHHYLIEKRVEQGRTFTVVSPLDHGGRVKELARIIGGVDITQAALSHAEDMLGRACS